MFHYGNDTGVFAFVMICPYIAYAYIINCTKNGLESFFKQ